MTCETGGTTPNGSAARRWRHRFAALPRLALLATGLAFLALLVLHSANEIPPLLRGTDWTICLLSLCLAVLGNLAVGLFFRNLLRDQGLLADHATAIEFLFYGQIAKYIPGKIWGVVYQIAAVKQANAARAVVVANLELTLGLLIINGVMAVSLLLWPVAPLLSIIAVILGAPVFTVACKPHRLVRFVVRKLLKQPQVVSAAPDASRSRSGPYLFCYGIVLACYLSASLLMMFAVFHFRVPQASAYIAYLTVGWIGGTLSILVPAGLGVRELIFLLLARQSGAPAPVELLATIAVVYRLWQVAQELVGAGGVCLWKACARASRSRLVDRIDDPTGRIPTDRVPSQDRTPTAER